MWPDRIASSRSEVAVTPPTFCFVGLAYSLTSARDSARELEREYSLAPARDIARELEREAARGSRKDAEMSRGPAEYARMSPSENDSRGRACEEGLAATCQPVHHKRAV